MRNVGHTGEKWFTCGMCGMDYPVRYLAWQDGKPRCTYLPCFDEGEEETDMRIETPGRIAEIYGD